MFYFLFCSLDCDVCIFQRCRSRYGENGFFITYSLVSERVFDVWVCTFPGWNMQSRKLWTSSFSQSKTAYHVYIVELSVWHLEANVLWMQKFPFLFVLGYMEMRKLQKEGKSIETLFLRILSSSFQFIHMMDELCFVCSFLLFFIFATRRCSAHRQKLTGKQRWELLTHTFIELPTE